MKTKEKLLRHWNSGELKGGYVNETNGGLHGREM